jgi:hypothetical protein
MSSIKIVWYEGYCDASLTEWSVCLTMLEIAGWILGISTILEVYAF